MGFECPLSIIDELRHRETVLTGALYNIGWIEGIKKLHGRRLIILLSLLLLSTISNAFNKFDFSNNKLHSVMILFISFNYIKTQ